MEAGRGRIAIIRILHAGRARTRGIAIDPAPACPDRGQSFFAVRCALRNLFISNMLADFLPKIFSSLSSALI